MTPDPRDSSPLVESEGVNAGSAATTDESAESAEARSDGGQGDGVRGGGRPQDAPGPWDDQDETDADDAELAGAPAESSAAAESGQDAGSIE